MKRRPYLRLAAATLTTAGCLGAAKSPGAPLSDAQPRPTRMAASDSARTRTVQRAETFEYVVRLNDLGDDPRGRITQFADLTDREQRVAETAIAEGYETRDPARWVVEFASGTPVLERGDYYRLEHTFPTYRITADSTAASDVAGEIATYGEYERAVTCEDYALTGLLRVARREGVELTYVWPALREFFATYEAVRYRGDLVSVSVEVTDPGPPYRISGAQVPVSEAVGGPVWNASEAPKASRELVRAAGRARGAYGFDRAPTGLLDDLRANEYVYLDGTFYTSAVEKRRPLPVSVSADFRDGRLRLALANEGDRELALSTGPPRPFGVVGCHPTGDSDSRRTLWTDAYAESEYVRTEGGEVEQVAEVALRSTLAPGETASETYAVGDLPSGEYAVTDSVEVEIGGARSTVRYRVTFRVR